MAKSKRKPRVTLRPGADQYAAPNERIVEFVGPDGWTGGLISLRSYPEGSLVVEVYRADPAVSVLAPCAALAPGCFHSAADKGVLLRRLPQLLPELADTMRGFGFSFEVAP